MSFSDGDFYIIDGKSRVSVYSNIRPQIIQIIGKGSQKSWGATTWRKNGSNCLSCIVDCKIEIIVSVRQYCRGRIHAVAGGYRSHHGSSLPRPVCRETTVLSQRSLENPALKQQGAERLILMIGPLRRQVNTERYGSLGRKHWQTGGFVLYRIKDDCRLSTPDNCGEDSERQKLQGRPRTQRTFFFGGFSPGISVELSF